MLNGEGNENGKKKMGPKKKKPYLAREAHLFVQLPLLLQRETS